MPIKDTAGTNLLQNSKEEKFIRAEIKNILLSSNANSSTKAISLYIVCHQMQKTTIIKYIRCQLL
jgi:hypothetical protein